jgi:hypothetical protein
MLILEALEGFEGPLNAVRYADLPIDDSFAEEYFAEAFFEPKAARMRVLGQSLVNLERMGDSL